MAKNFDHVSGEPEWLIRRHAAEVCIAEIQRRCIVSIEGEWRSIAQMIYSLTSAIVPLDDAKPVDQAARESAVALLEDILKRYGTTQFPGLHQALCEGLDDLAIGAPMKVADGQIDKILNGEGGEDDDELTEEEVGAMHREIAKQTLEFPCDRGNQTEEDSAATDRLLRGLLRKSILERGGSGHLLN